MHSKYDTPNVPDSLRYWHSEAESFRTVVNAMDAALYADVIDSDRWRKLAHIRFIAATLQRFLERLFASEECEHLTELEQHPEWKHRVDGLRREHLALRNRMSRTVFQLDRTCAANPTACDEVFGEVSQLIQAIQKHMHKENEFVQDCLTQDLGGEAG